MYIIKSIANSDSDNIALRILAWIAYIGMSMAWSIVALFAVPAIVFYNMGPFQAIGKGLNTLSTAIDTIDNIVTRTSKLIDTGFDAIEIPANNMLADLRCDSIVDDAKRDAKITTAQTEAESIRSALKPKQTRGRAKTTTKK
jgi:hypothetical protein